MCTHCGQIIICHSWKLRRIWDDCHYINIPLWFLSRKSRDDTTPTISSTCILIILTLEHMMILVHEIKPMLTVRIPLITVSPASPFGIVSERNNCLNAAGFGVSHAHVPHVSWKVYVLKCWNCLTLGCSIQPVCTDLARATHANCQPRIAGWFISQHLFLSTLQGWSTLQNIDFTRKMRHMCMLDFPHIVKHSSACFFLKRFQKDLLGRLLSAMAVGGYISG